MLLASALAGCGSKEPLLIGSNDFVLLRRDEFDELDSSYWELATHSFGDNLAWFTETNATAEGGFLVLTISKEQAPAAPQPGEAPKPYAAAELRTRAPFLYGRFRARARLAPGVGVISAFWGFYDRYAMSSGAQLDNQIVTEATHSPDSQLRYNVVAADGAPPAESANIELDPSQGYHVLGYDWTPSQVRFYFDGVPQWVVSGEAAEALRQYQRLVLSAYPSRAGWTGTFDESVLPVSASFDWVEIYEYSGERP